MKTSSLPVRSRRAAFSLAELMVVVVILGLLATLVVPNVMRQLELANVGKAVADLTMLDVAVRQYRIENEGAAPTSLEALIEKDASGHAYLDRDTLPIDPWDREYQYDPPGSSDEDHRIYTLGRDGEVGGEGAARDIDHRMVRNQEV